MLKSCPKWKKKVNFSAVIAGISKSKRRIPLRFVVEDNYEVKIKGVADSGADVNAMSRGLAEQFEKEIIPTDIMVRSVDGKILNCYGTISLTVRLDELELIEEFYIFDNLSSHIFICTDTMIKWGIIDSDFPMRKFKDGKLIARKEVKAKPSSYSKEDSIMAQIKKEIISDNSENLCRQHQEFLPSRRVKFADTRVTGGAVYPMEKVSVYLFDGPKKLKYLVTVDRYSNYMFVNRIKEFAAENILNILQTIFMDYGYPESIRSDGGSQFRGPFTRFCTENNIEHELVTPSNGLAENAVERAKYLISKVGTYGFDFRKELMDWRNTPMANGKSSPAEVMFGRTLRRDLPMYWKGKPVMTPETQFKKGMKVRIQDPKTSRWNKVVKLGDQRKSGSWKIVDVDGFQCIRNERFIRRYVSPDDPMS